MHSGQWYALFPLDVGLLFPKTESIKNIRASFIINNNIIQKIIYEKNQNFIELANQYLIHHDFSRVEYFTILPVKNTHNKFVVWFSVNNATDSRIMDLFVYNKEDDNWKLIRENTISINGNDRWFEMFSFSNKDYKIVGKFYDKEDTLKENILETKEITFDSHYFYNDLQHNGYIEFK